MPLALTLPLHFDLHLRKRRWRRLAVGILVVLAVALLAVGFWLPAKAERGGEAFIGVDRGLGGAATLAIGDELVIESWDGSALTYEVAALDIVDGARVELEPSRTDDVIVIIADWPFEAGAIRDRWRYVVTARARF
jgi:hypothetical protein